MVYRNIVTAKGVEESMGTKMRVKQGRCGKTPITRGKGSMILGGNRKGIGMAEAM